MCKFFRSLAIYLSFAAPVLLGDQTLSQFFAFTDLQKTAFATLNQAFQTYSSQLRQKTNDLQSEIDREYSKPSPDPYQLGSRYSAIELLKRDLKAHEATLSAQVASLLTPVQISQVNALVSAQRLRSIAEDAACADLLPSSRSGYFSAFAALLLGGIDLPSAPTASFCGDRVFPASVRQYFSLSDSQISEIVAADTGFQLFVLASQNRRNDLQQAIASEIAKPVPDPVQLGILYLQVHANESELATQRSRLIDQAKAVLTNPQTQKLDALLDVQALSTVTVSAYSCYLFAPPPGTEGYFYYRYPCAL